LSKVLRLTSYIENTNEGNVANRVILDYKEICLYLFSDDFANDPKLEKISKFLKLDNRKIYEHVLENNTSATENAYLSDGLNYMTNRDSLISRFNLCYEQFANKKGVMINLEALLRVKLVRARMDIETELNYF